MARNPSPEIDDELFNEVYGKEYTGPPKPSSTSAAVHTANKRPFADEHSAEEDEPPDPNAVPTDFTSREARVWEAKAKATERNWKKRKEEEMICKICGEAGHFTQGCPSTLGASRKSAEFFERVPARDKHVRDLFPDKVIIQIEKDVGCKLKMEEKFLIVSGKDKLVLSKGVDAVHKIIQDGDKGINKGSTSSRRTRSRSPDRNPMGSRYRRSDSQRSHSSPRNTPRFHGRISSQERGIEDRVREDLQKLSRNTTSHGRAYANDGARGQTAHSRSPARATFGGDAYNSFGHNRNTGMHKNDNWNIERYAADFRDEQKLDFPTFPQTLEELEMEFKREAMEVGKLRDKEEDEENHKHREYVRELRDNYMKKLANLRGMHLKQWEEFLQLDAQRRQQARHNAYNQPAYPEYNQSRDAHYGGTNLSTDSRSRHPYRGQDYPASRPHDVYGDLEHQKHDDFGRSYGR
ncbi:uncharacterized protein M6B38_176300 [Iris pallida]|uniref:CCHC-type domain-containing protein n=1 Tax=Iris pallida TaxID=29817 RepID=A0AAX6EQ31_IRIPA|nr:uncharacterized protein M6B38_176300 [Iris pallida]